MSKAESVWSMEPDNHLVKLRCVEFTILLSEIGWKDNLILISINYCKLASAVPRYPTPARQKRSPPRWKGWQAMFKPETSQLFSSQHCKANYRWYINVSPWDQDDRYQAESPKSTNKDDPVSARRLYDYNGLLTLKKFLLILTFKHDTAMVADYTVQRI